ncbi:MAG: AAA family ATPase [Candidatus Binatia bacterium]
MSLRYLKRFEDEKFDLSDTIVLAGPNNSGKSTLLQALAVWNLAIQRWRVEKGVGPTGAKSPGPGNAGVTNERSDLIAPPNRESDSASADEPGREPPRTRPKKPKSRPGVRISRKDFTAIPLRGLDLLWHNRHLLYRKGEGGPKTKPGTHKLLRIDVQGEHGAQDWQLPFELRYENPETLYAIPAVPDPYAAVAEVAKAVQVVHVPPFSGIGAEETRYDRPYQDLLIGQGKPGDILRNLLLDVYGKESPDDWQALCNNIRELFGYTLFAPSYEGRPYILCEYAPGDKPRPGQRGKLRLDIACAGSGFHQVLMLLGFFYARPASVLLLDEPDAHQHVLLQGQMYDRLKQIARERKCQLIIATHSEVLLEATAVTHVMSFYGPPHLLEKPAERDRIREALKRLTALDLLLVEKESGILYTEGRSDLQLLREWARVLKHPVLKFLEKPIWHNNVGRHPKEAKAHHFALRALRPHVRGILLLDGDDRNLPDRELLAEGLEIVRWTRYEIANYLVVPDVLCRFVTETGLELYASAAARQGREFLKSELPPAVLRDPLGSHDYLNATAASKELLPQFFRAADMDVPKTDYYQIAAIMQPDEINDEVKQQLDQIATSLSS